MAIFAPDCVGSPSGSTLQQNLHSIICQPPAAANPLSVSRHDLTTTVNTTGVFNHYQKHYHGLGTHVYET